MGAKKTNSLGKGKGPDPTKEVRTDGRGGAGGREAREEAREEAGQQLEREAETCAGKGHEVERRQHLKGVRR